MRSSRMFVSVVLASTLAAPVIAAPDAAAIRRSVTLRDDWMYLTRDVAEPAQWSHEGKRLHYRKTVEGGFAFVEIDARTLKRRAPFDAGKLAVALGDATKQSYQPLRLPFETFEYADENRAITVTLGEERWTCRIVNYACHKAEPTDTNRPRAFGVVRDLEVPADNQPRKSPDEKWEAFVEDDNVVVRAVGSKDVIALSTDGTPGNFYDPETLAWSPDSTRLVAYRVRPGFRRIVTRVEAAPSNQLQPALREQLYPKPGDAVDIEQPVLFHVAERRRADIDNALFPNPYEMSQPEWRKDGRTFVFDYERRGHGQARVIEVDGQTGTPKAVITEDAKTFVYADRRYRHDVGDDAREIVWISERDGWRHLYLSDAATGALKQITRGPWVVRDVLKVDDAQRRIWFSASGMDAGKDPYFKHVFRVDFDGANLTRLTTADATHEVRFAPDMSAYVDTYSRVDLPTVSELHRADGTLIATLERGDISRLTAAGWTPPEPFVAKGRDGATDIWGLIVRPRDYDPSKKYPVLENIYAGPHDSFVPKTFWPFGFHSGGDKAIGMQAQADLGFIVVQIDGMGTANRSKAFHDVAWKNLADSGFPDRILWHKALAARDPSYDISRVGIYGASAGGQSALNALLFHPEFYKAAVAYAGCYDNRMDKISWNEQWLGWPVDASYAAASGVDHAAKLQGQLLLIVGEQDSNVDPASTMQVVDALIKADKDFELLVVPGGEHSVGRSTGPIPYVQRRQFEFFVRALQDVRELEVVSELSP
ncbi:S9 family peptidase [Peristeroidobacter agariperforans]|uniref:S9 family peptidase n=1 Tax=Peristeroidobacter agariperforans TaxID=268404 RepID=UPI00101C544E|nr:S9 family peptidase [Peristeroidobacter agariperforans]